MTDRPIAVISDKKYYEVHSSEAARIFGVSPSTVKSWIKRGCPTRGGAGSGKPTFLYLPEVIQWWQKEAVDTFQKYSKNRSLQQLVIRDKIDGLGGMDRIKEHLDELDGIQNGIRTQHMRFISINMNVDALDKVSLTESFNNDQARGAQVRMKAIEIQANILLKLLNKICPDLRPQGSEPDEDDPAQALKKAIVSEQ